MRITTWTKPTWLLHHLDHKKITIFRTPFRKGKGASYTNSSWGLLFLSSSFYNTNKEKILNKFYSENQKQMSFFVISSTKKNTLFLEFNFPKIPHGRMSVYRFNIFVSSVEKNA